MKNTANMMIIEDVMKSLLEARRGDPTALNGEPVPDSWEWLNESDARHDFGLALRGVHDREEMKRVFSVAMAECEKCGIVERSSGPYSTSIRLKPHH